jgi:hypothetical protein
MYNRLILSFANVDATVPVDAISVHHTDSKFGVRSDEEFRTLVIKIYHALSPFFFVYEKRYECPVIVLVFFVFRQRYFLTFARGGKYFTITKGG